jgi:steroid 5-alpha reductase family enzyme
MSEPLWPLVGWMLLWCAGGAVVWALAAFVLARVMKRNNIVDTLWGLGFCLIAVEALFAAVQLGSGDPVRRVLLLVTVLTWGLRLSWHVGRRSAGKGEDPRYARLLESRPGSPTRVAVTFIYGPQALTLFIVSLSVQVGMVEPGGVRWIGWLGAAIWLVGVMVESVGDAQMSRFKADPGNKGKIADVGLWSYTRHPNYFGDAAVWVGIFVITADRWPGVVTVISPALMTYLLAFGTGKRLLEKSMRNRDGYQDYARRTSGFIPLPHWLTRRR